MSGGSPSKPAMPIETSLIFGFPEFRWRPLPVFQAYVTYTPALDELNADLLRSARAFRVDRAR